MVWRCFSQDGISPIHCFIGIMDQYGYKDIIEKVMKHAKDKMRQVDFSDHDNDQEHTAGSIKTFLIAKKFEFSFGHPKVLISIQLRIYVNTFIGN